MSDNYFIQFCAPTLAKQKTASLFRCRFDDENDFDKWLTDRNKQFSPMGLCLCTLRRQHERSCLSDIHTSQGISLPRETSKAQWSALVMLYRRSQLEAILSDPENRDFLTNFGYPPGTGSHAECIETLKSRTQACDPSCFPHEIGIFLGYPLCDVRGFIENRGQNFKAAGDWKVYENVEETVKSFRSFDNCRRIYRRLWSSGKMSIAQLTVAG
ncbi:MAG: DUF3793 family protein [Eubacterium sp.]|jgi:hypothetical protein